MGRHAPYVVHRRSCT